MNNTPPLTYLHPEIEQPADRNPADMSCEELAAEGAPQLIPTNFLAAACMFATFWRVTQVDETCYSEMYFDVMTGSVRAAIRAQDNTLV